MSKFSWDENVTAFRFGSFFKILVVFNFINELININIAGLKFYDCSIEKMIKIRTPFDRMIKLDSKVLN